MPLREFRCPNNHLTERIILSRAEDDNTTTIPCTCGQPAIRLDISRTGSPILIGEGFYKPSNR